MAEMGRETACHLIYDDHYSLITMRHSGKYFSTNSFLPISCSEKTIFFGRRIDPRATDVPPRARPLFPANDDTDRVVCATLSTCRSLSDGIRRSSAACWQTDINAICRAPAQTAAELPLPRNRPPRPLQQKMFTESDDALTRSLWSKSRFLPAGRCFVLSW